MHSYLREPSFVSQNFQLLWKGGVTLNRNMARTNNSARKSRQSFNKSGNFSCKCIDKGPEGLDWLLSDVVRDAVRYMSWRMTENGRHSIRGCIILAL